LLTDNGAVQHGSQDYAGRKPGQNTQLDRLTESRMTRRAQEVHYGNSQTTSVNAMFIGTVIKNVHYDDIRIIFAFSLSTRSRIAEAEDTSDVCKILLFM
jgi:hypothetical protein